MKKLIWLAIFLANTLLLFAEGTTVSFVPFVNSNGEMKYDEFAIALQDSLQKQFIKTAEEVGYKVLSYEDVKKKLDDNNIKPGDAQYESYLWQFIEEMGAKYVISGSVLNQAGKFIINTYIYDVSMKIQVTSHVAKDIFVPENNILRAVVPIHKRLIPFFKQ